jgi:hypothetical protein
MDAIQYDMQKNPTKWIMECPKCGSVVNIKYVLNLCIVFERNVLDHYYCPCDRFQKMALKPAHIFSFQSLLIYRAVNEKIRA